MQNLQLGWQPAAALSFGLAVGSVAAYRGGRTTRLAPYLRESALVAALYSLWQLAASVSVLGPSGALSRGRWIAEWERRWLPLPSERTVQRTITGHPLLAQGANWFYAAMHFTALGLLLLWLFVRHRDRYPRVRNVLVALTASSLLIQLIPVAPPRLLPQLGFVDTAAQYGQSVYGISGISVDQLSAMPSVHVGWALLVAWAVLTVGTGPRRWWVLLHPLLTCFVVVATANHFWLDGIVAAVLLAGSIAGVELSGRRFGQVGTDHGDAGAGRGGHVGQRLPDTGERDPAGDELVGPQRS
jgi:PAP2 superfamily protein